MKKTVLSVLIMLFAGAISFAHQPRLVYRQAEIKVVNPEVSQAFYGELGGRPAVYTISSGKPFSLYVGVLVPDIKGIQKNISARITGNSRPVAFLDGNKFQWEPYFEPFGGDNYYKGPEFRKTVKAGDYKIEVFSNSNKGKYVVAIGEKEEWPLNETLATLRDLPVLKSAFFGKSAFLGYYNYVGVFLLIVLFLVIAVVLLIVLLVKRIFRRK